MRLAGIAVPIGHLADIQATSLRAAEQAVGRVLGDVRRCSGWAAFLGEQAGEAAHGDADALGHAFATEGRVAELFGDEAFGGEQVGGAQRADAVLARLPGDDAGEQFQHFAFEVIGPTAGGAVEEALGAFEEGAGEQALQAGFRADLERVVEAAQAAFAEQLLGDVEDELAHGAGEAEEVRLVGAVNDHLPRL